ncbi:MAG: PIN domain-containing protein [Candidatus Brockarchaeota archaeon]|nr:PIN domain-containing protein [Candidatus Brockarchaeota archaeon]
MRRRSLRESLEAYVVDTGVLVEYIVRGSPHRSAVEKLLNDVLKKNVKLYVTPITVSELIYVASRLYELAGVEKPNEEALNFVKWLTTRAKTVEVAPDIAVEVGELRKKLRIALSDCYVIATAIKLQAKALFLRPEKEMLDRIEELRELPIAFLTEASLR